MTVAMAAIVTTHADTLAEALVVVVLAGLLQVVLGALRAGRFVVYTPYVVVSGFMHCPTDARQFVEDPDPGGNLLGDLPGVVQRVLRNVVEDATQIAPCLMGPRYHCSISRRRASCEIACPASASSRPLRTLSST